MFTNNSKGLGKAIRCIQHVLLNNLMSSRKRRTQSVKYYQILSYLLKKEQDLKEKWHQELDKKLLSVVREDKLIDWEIVASNFDNFRSSDCLKRYRHLKDIQNTKGQWNTTEDELLSYAVEKLGDSSWLHIASLVPGRNSKQCRERWCNQINPDINHSPFTLEEEQLLISKQEQLGNKWSKISKFFKGRPDNMLKNMWHSLCTQRKFKKNNNISRTKKNTNQNKRKRARGQNNKKNPIKEKENNQKIRKPNNHHSIFKNDEKNLCESEKSDNQNNKNGNKIELKSQEMVIKQSKTQDGFLNLQQNIKENNKLTLSPNVIKSESSSLLINHQVENNSSQNQKKRQLSLKEKWVSTPAEDEEISSNQEINMLLDTTETLDKSLMVMQYTLFNPENSDNIYIPVDNEFDQYYDEQFDNETDFGCSFPYEDLEDVEDLNSEFQTIYTDLKNRDFYN
ncbi:snRNA-activating protein complex subunit [Anaeramoeba flamelloides]|uniref:snRNA-activating protein complex subunit n=1 Tax=Anaeramoeba flamelloides TaxID=1746091 RepID=A0AAV7ZC36_9EUKA|nr:snRNA-activating protein complex subunit [Anaeramoeba flamelloides]